MVRVQAEHCKSSGMLFVREVEGQAKLQVQTPRSSSAASILLPTKPRLKGLVRYIIFVFGWWLSAYDQHRVRALKAVQCPRGIAKTGHLHLSGSVVDYQAASTNSVLRRTSHVICGESGDDKEVGSRDVEWRAAVLDQIGPSAGD